jgi:hypothetical protein
MGMKQLPKRSGEYLFEIIMRRNQVRSTVMTSNRPLEDWGKLIGDVPAAAAILDRFLHNAKVAGRAQSLLANLWLTGRPGKTPLRDTADYERNTLKPPPRCDKPRQQVAAFDSIIGGGI